ncbi:MAG: bifunctional [glutamine synthetase] adenylyltransferase/[glutamine synthetase]-adenylyl-L-tyrosine phosphorylase [Maritimibacter sp.]
MSFASRITRVPVAFDPAAGAEIAAAFSDVTPELRELLSGMAGCSPYLKGLLEREALWLRAALPYRPETALEMVLGEIRASSQSELNSVLRQAKQRVALLTALADLGGVWSLEEVTGALTRFADRATHEALCFHVGQEIRRGKLPGAVEDDIPTAAGAVALAMGKMGAGELNYSSDIDLIMLFDESRFERDDFHEARASFIRATRRMAASLSEMTAEGYVFRTDLRLRPDPSVTPVIMAMATAEQYYESLGRTWERAAHIKARPAAGDLEAGARYLERLRPFIWRKHLDFAAIQDAHDIRLRIREHKGTGGPLVLEGHDMKLGRGGIREIEFFTQTRQLIAGGRDLDLRKRGTVEGLAALTEGGWLTTDVSEVLTRHYRKFREVEHRLQMVQDAQTQKLPGSEDEFRRIVNMMGESDVAAWKRRLHAELDEVQAVTEEFFTPDDRHGTPVDLADFTPEDAEIVERWRNYPACRSPRAAELFARLKPDLLARLSKAARPREALVEFDAFLRGLPAGVQLFSLFDANPALVDLIVDIASTAPALARYLGRNSQVFDAVLGGDFFGPWPGETELVTELSTHLNRHRGDYEEQLDLARRWMKEWHFRIGVHHLRGLIGAREAGAQYTDLADAVLRALWPVVMAEFCRKHGTPPGRGAAIIGMGSLGARIVSASSDLDLIVVYDAAGVESSNGPRPLASRSYYAKLTQAMVTALSAPMPEGKLYEVDMRLRPSGRQGPVATSLESFRAYQRDEAWTWEHLALTRARPVAGNGEIGDAVEALRKEVLEAPRDAKEVIGAVIEMRARIAEARGGRTPALDMKHGAGRLQDIELCAQCAALLAPGSPRDVASQITDGIELGWLHAEEATALLAAYDFLRRVQAAQKLLSDEPPEIGSIGKGGLDFLLRESGQADAEALIARIEELAKAAETAIEAALTRLPGEVSDAIGDMAGDALGNA